MVSVLEGTTLGHHQLKRLLGRGGMAEVYLAFDEHLHRDVAIKVVHQSKNEDFRRFQREAETIGPLTHEHILPVFEYGEQPPWHYLVMPYMPHGTLSDRLKSSGPLAPREAGIILDHVASALQFVHQRGILHRDIKPSNILLRDASYAYLADFGIAKAQERENGLTRAGSLLGTPAYMAPELVEGDASPRSDIYALGVVLYQMLTGQLPFEGKTPTALLLKQMQEAPLRPSLHNPVISPALEQVILQALEKDPHRRFQTAQALATAYMQALQEPQPQGVVPPPPPPSASWFSDATIESAAPTINTSTSFQGAPIPARFSSSLRVPRRILVAGMGILLLVALLLWVGQSNGHSVQTNSTTSQSSTPLVTASADPCSGRVSLQDNAQILEPEPVCIAAKHLPYTVAVYTTTTFAKRGGDLDHMAQSLVTDPQMVVIAIAIDTTHPAPKAHTPHVHITIVGGDSVSIPDSQYHRAIDTFNREIETGNYTQATIDAIQVLQTSDS